MDARDLPPGPERSWLPAFTQSLSVEFCEQREHELSRYLQRLVGFIVQDSELTEPALSDLVSDPRSLLYMLCVFGRFRIESLELWL